MSTDALARAFELFWHPVCTEAELAATHGGRGPMAVTLLGRKLVVARLGDAVAGDGSLVAFDARCPHRSASLACGSIEADGVRCGYHGWRYGVDGRCNDIPALPDGPIPARAAVGSYDVTTSYGLVWVRLDGSAGTTIPACPGWEQPAMRLVPGMPYTWPVGAPRRVENFVDLSHFAFVHDGSLGRRDDPVPPVPVTARDAGELRFVFEPPPMDVDAGALYGRSRYRMPMPLTVSIEFQLASGANRVLWMTASPIDMATCRAFWLHGRDDDVLGDDAPYVTFQARILAEDEPVVCSQDPPELPLEAGIELSVRTDKVSIEYRHWLRELADAAVAGGGQAVAAVLGASVVAASS